MEQLQHFSHEHPLLFIQDRSHESEKTCCYGCGVSVSGPSYGCVECKFYLDKQCAEAPSKMNHPFHHNHRLQLFKRPPAGPVRSLAQLLLALAVKRAPAHVKRPPTQRCGFCKQTCKNFVYHCSCGLDLHVKCALFSYDIAEKRRGDFQQIARIDPSISMENQDEEIKKGECFACWKPLLDSVYFSPDCGFHLHAKCVDLPPQIDHSLHPQHPLVLQFNSKCLPCKICRKSQLEGFVYCCSRCDFVLHIECSSLPTTIKKPYHRNHPLALQKTATDLLDCQICQETTQSDEFVYSCSVCKFVLHVGCASPPPIIEDKIHHDHPFTLLQKQVSLNCDACGTLGNFVPYICSTCNIMVHKKCISLPRIIQFFRHRHRMPHTYSIDGFEAWACRYCYEKVNTEHGSYFCSKCKYIVHVNCVFKAGHYIVVDSMEEAEEDVEDSIEYMTGGTSVRHFCHDHILALGEAVKPADHKQQCDACLLPISTTYYYCSQCDFFLHEACAKLPRKKHLWFHYCQKHLRLTSGRIFRCNICGYLTSGFCYNCDGCKNTICFRCALISDIPRCEGHEHIVPFYRNHKASCSACGRSTSFAYRCKTCDFNLCGACLGLPLEARHNFDEHPFKLTYHDNSNYIKSHVCDICEKERNPNHWFYHCATCDSSAHRECVLGKYPYIKPGSIYEYGNHRHPLTFVRKVHLYPDCSICGKHCIDLSLECKDGCNYVVHWECINLLNLEDWPRKDETK